MYENTLIISLKLLRNKVVLFCFFTIPVKRKVHIGAGAQGQALGRASRSVETLVAVLPLLEDHGPHHGTHDDAQERAQQQQERPPARQGPATEVPRRVVHVV